MPETRCVKVYKDGVYIGEEDCVEVSDEQLALEAEEATCREYLSHSPDVITQPQMWFLLRCFAKKLGYRFE